MKVFAKTWIAGAPGLHRPLDKLLGTWTDVFPSHVLEEVRRRRAMGSRTVLGNGHATVAPPLGVPPATGHKPMKIDPRLALGQCISMPVGVPMQISLPAGPPIVAGVPSVPAMGHASLHDTAATGSSVPPAFSATVPDLMSLLSAVTAVKQKREGTRTGTSGSQDMSPSSSTAQLESESPPLVFNAKKIKVY